MGAQHDSGDLAEDRPTRKRCGSLGETPRSRTRLRGPLSGAPQAPRGDAGIPSRIPHHAALLPRSKACRAEGALRPAPERQRRGEHRRVRDATARQGVPRSRDRRHGGGSLCGRARATLREAGNGADAEVSAANAGSAGKSPRIARRSSPSTRDCRFFPTRCMPVSAMRSGSTRPSPLSGRFPAGGASSHRRAAWFPLPGTAP